SRPIRARLRFGTIADIRRCRFRVRARSYCSGTDSPRQWLRIQMLATRGLAYAFQSAPACVAVLGEIGCRTAAPPACWAAVRRRTVECSIEMNHKYSLAGSSWAQRSEKPNACHHPDPRHFMRTTNRVWQKGTTLLGRLKDVQVGVA